MSVVDGIQHRKGSVWLLRRSERRLTSIMSLKLPIIAQTTHPSSPFLRHVGVFYTVSPVAVLSLGDVGLCDSYTFSCRGGGLRGFGGSGFSVWLGDDESSMRVVSCCIRLLIMINSLISSYCLHVFSLLLLFFYIVAIISVIVIIRIVIGAFQLHTQKP